MRHLSSRIIVVLVSSVLALPLAARTASQDASQQASSQDSVANAARRNRDKKKVPSTSPKSTKVLTDDDLDRKNYQPGQDGLNVGASPKLETEPPSDQAVARAEAADAAKNGSLQEAKEAAEQGEKISKLKLEITEAENGLDLARRQLALDQDSYYSKTDYARDTAGKAKLEDEKQGISDREQKIEKLKSRLAALEASKSRTTSERPSATPPAKTENPASAP